MDNTELDDKKLKAFLEGLYYVYARRELVYPDPLWYLYKYDDIRDREVVGLIASSLAYGRVSQIMKSVERVLSCLGTRPREFLLKNGDSDIVPSSFKHRFTTSYDMNNFLRNIRKAIIEYDTIENLLASNLPADVSKLAMNTSNLSDNTSNLAVNVSSLSGNASSSPANISSFTENTSNLSRNSSSLPWNAPNLSGNSSSLSDNTPNVPANSSNVLASSSNLSGNSSNLSTNISKLPANNMKIFEALDKFSSFLTRGAKPKSFPLMTSPLSGSAGKRLYLCLRWLVRSLDVDPGGWTALKPSQLLIPCDTHILSIAQHLGLIRSHTSSFKSALIISAKFFQLSPSDTAKFDFPLTRFGLRSGLPALYTYSFVK